MRTALNIATKHQMSCARQTGWRTLHTVKRDGTRKSGKERGFWESEA